MNLNDYPLDQDTTDDEILEMIEHISHQLEVEHGVAPGPQTRCLIDGTATKRDMLIAALTILISTKFTFEVRDDKEARENA